MDGQYLIRIIFNECFVRCTIKKVYIIFWMCIVYDCYNSGYNNCYVYK